MSKTPQLQLAHVLFLDLVVYSLLKPLERQFAVLQELQDLVRFQPELLPTARSGRARRGG